MPSINSSTSALDRVGSYITSAFAGALLLGLTTAALAVTGEYSNMCTMGLAVGKDIQTDCSIGQSAKGQDRQ